MLARRLLASLLTLVLYMGLIGCTDSSAPMTASNNSGSNTAEDGGTPVEASSATAASPINDPTGSTLAPTSGGAAIPTSNSSPKPADSTPEKPAVTSPPANSPTTDKPAPTVQELMQQAQAQLTAGNLDGAIATVRKATAMEPANRQLQLVPALLLRQQAAKTMEGGDSKKGYGLFKQVGEEARKFKTAFADLRPNEKQFVSEAFYNEACAHSKDGDTAKAMASLKESLNDGFSDASLLETDEDLNPLRELAEFKTLVAEHVAKAAEKAREEIKELFAKHQPFDFSFELPDLEDKPVSLAQLKGKVVIVDVWGTWCPPCKQEIPHFIALKKKYADKGFEIVGINYERVGADEVKETIKNFITEVGINYPCVIGDEATQKLIPDLQGYPTTLFVDRAGKVRLKVVGYHNMQVLDAAVSELLAEPAPKAEGEAQPEKSG